MTRTWRLLSLLLTAAAPAAERQPSASIVGTWELVSRVERDSTGRVVPDSSLGTDPVGLLVYDAAGHVAVQIMKRRRTGPPCAVTAKADVNNPAQFAGYDANYGRYEMNRATRTITHHLEGALGPEDVGRTVTREYRLEGDTLTLWYRPGGPRDTHTRTLAWHRVSR